MASVTAQTLRPLKTAPRKTILVVEDEANVRSAIRRLLHGLPYVVLTAANGKEGLATAVEKQPDLIFLDVRMPVMDGFTCLEAIRAAGLNDIPVVMLTAEADIMKGYLSGASYYITKPFQNEDIINIIEFLIGDVSDERRAWLELQI